MFNKKPIRKPLGFTSGFVEFFVNHLLDISINSCQFLFLYVYMVEVSGLRYGYYPWHFGFAPALVDNANNASLTPFSQNRHKKTLTSSRSQDSRVRRHCGKI